MTARPLSAAARRRTSSRSPVMARRLLAGRNGYRLHMATADPLALWWGQEAACPVVAVAIHAGHALRDEVAGLTAVAAERRFREEDPGTAEWATWFPTRLVAGRSRFEVDLNRPRDSAVYRCGEDCWDLEPWHGPL